MIIVRIREYGPLDTREIFVPYLVTNAAISYHEY